MTGPRREADQAGDRMLAQRREILSRHARLYPSGTPMLCAPSRAEQRDPDALWRWQGSDDKVILIDEQHAKDAAKELSALYGKPMYVYPCPRSRRGHYHLTSKPPREAKK